MTEGGLAHIRERLTDRTQILRGERQTITRQQKMLLVLATATAFIAASLILYGLYRAVNDTSLARMWLSEVSGAGTGIASGTFGWLARNLSRRLAELDKQEIRNDDIHQLLTCTLMISDPTMRSATIANIAEALINHLYGNRQHGNTDRTKTDSGK